MAEQYDDWLKIARESFSNSTNYLDNTLRNQWVDNIRMFNNEHPMASKYNTELFSKRSRIFRPKTRSSVMKFEAATVTAFFSTQDVVDITPENPNDPEQVASAKISQNLLNYRLTKTLPWYQLLTAAAQEAWKMGAVCSYQSWKYVKNNDGEVVADEPQIELIPLENLRIDKSADWIDPINSSPYVIRLIPMYVVDVKSRMRNSDDEKTDSNKWFPLEDREILTARESDIDSIRIAREGKQRIDPKEGRKPISDYDIVWVHQNIVNKEGQDYIYYTLAEFKMLSAPQKLEEVYPNGRPFVMGSCINEAFRVWKTGMPELGQGIQEEINNIANDRLDNVHLVINKRYFAKRGRNVDFRSLLRNIPGSITMMDNPLEDVEVISTPDITGSAYQEQDRLNVDYDELIGNFSSGSVQTNNKMNETVGGLSMVASGAGQITEYLIRNFIETWVEPVLRQVSDLEVRYETDQNVLAVAAGPEQAALYQRYGMSPTVDELLKNKLTLSVNVGIAATNPQQKVDKFMFAINALGSIMNSPIAQIGNMKEISTEIFGLLGYKGGSRFFAEGDPQVNMLKQQMQQMQQALESKQLELDKKYQIDSEKLEFEKGKFVAESGKTEAEIRETEAKALETMASAEKTKAETIEIVSGVQNQIKMGELQLEDKKVSTDANIALMKDKTERDKILADWEKQRETDEAKLKITLVNSQGEPSNDLATLGEGEE